MLKQAGEEGRGGSAQQLNGGGGVFFVFAYITCMFSLFEIEIDFCVELVGDGWMDIGVYAGNQR